MATVLWPTASAVASVLGGFASSKTTAMQASLVPLVLALAVAASLHEPQHRRQGPSISDVLVACREAARQPGLLCLFGFGVVTYAFSETPHKFKGIFLASRGLSSQGTGALMAAVYLVSSFGAVLAKPVSASWGHRPVLIACVLGAAICQAAACLLGSAAIALPLLLAAFIWGLQGPVSLAMVHAEIGSSRCRVTIMSLLALVRGLGVVACAPALSATADRWSIETAYAACSVLLLLGLVPLLWIPRREVKHQEGDKKELTSTTAKKTL